MALVTVLSNERSILSDKGLFNNIRDNFCCFTYTKERRFMLCIGVVLGEWICMMEISDELDNYLTL